MIYKYVVTLENTSRRLVDRFSILLSSASVLLFLLQYISSDDKRMMQLIGATVIALLVGFNIFRLKKLGKSVTYSYALFVTALTWASMPYFPWLSALFLVMALVERQAKKNLEIGFNDDRIVFNSIPRKQYDWEDFTNIMLRDNLLTLDFKNNKLIQRETADEEEGEDDCSEEEFNNYCRDRLNHSIPPFH